MESNAAASTVLESNPWAELRFYERWKTLELKWLPSSKNMTDDQVKASLEMFAGCGEKLRPKFMMIDALEFARGFTDEILAWREANIIPSYNRAGIEKFALVVREGYPGTVEKGAKPAPEGSATFPTGWFSTLERAYQWLGN